MIYIGNLTDAQAMACAKKMLERNRVVLCNQIVEAVKARQVVPAARVRKPRRRVAQTGELA